MSVSWSMRFTGTIFGPAPETALIVVKCGSIRPAAIFKMLESMPLAGITSFIGIVL